MKKKLFQVNTDLKQDIIEKMKIPSGDIAIIGMAARLPGSESVKEFWEKLLERNDFITELSTERKKDIMDYWNFKSTDWKDKQYAQASFLDEIDKFDPAFFGLSHKEASVMDPYQRIFLETVWNALENAGYTGERIKGSKTGVYVGQHSNSGYLKWVMDTEPEYKILAEPGNIASIMASRISYMLDLNGPSMLIDTACSSSLVSAHLASQALKNGDCDMAITGGINLILDPVYDKKEEQLDIMSSDYRTKTFDESSDGTGLGEGSIVFILKPLSKAVYDRDNIHAVIKGSAINQDGSSIGITAPNAMAQKKVILNAWKKANVNLSKAGYIEAHGTGTKIGDPIEMKGLLEAFRQITNEKDFCYVGSVKANVGHLDSAAGAIGLLKAVLCLKEQKIPPLAHFKQLNNKINIYDSPLMINTEAVDWKNETDNLHYAGVSAFGLSGTNCHIVLEEADNRLFPDSVTPSEYKLLCVSAKTKKSLKIILKEYVNAFYTLPEERLSDFCYSANFGRMHFEHRVAIVAADIEEFKESIQCFLEHGCIEDDSEIKTQKVNYTTFTRVGSMEKDLQNEQNLQQASYEVNMKLDSMLQNSSKLDKSILEYVADEYCKGIHVNWSKVYEYESQRMMDVPLYQFEKKRCWIEVPELGDEKMKSDAVETVIKEYFRDYIAEEYELAREDVGYDDDFFELGIDSINIIQIKQEVKSKYYIDIAVEKLFSEINNINQLSAFIVANTENQNAETVEQVQQPERLSVQQSPAAVEKESYITPARAELSSFERITTTSQEEMSMEQAIINKQLEIMEKQLIILRNEGSSCCNVNNMQEIIARKPKEEDIKPKQMQSSNNFFRRFVVKEDEELNKGQEEFLNEFIAKYTSKTKKSKELTTKYRKNWSNDRFIQGYSEKWKTLIYPIMFDRAEGANIWDVDGNKYLDFSMGFGAIILGYNNLGVAEQIGKMYEQGAIIGPVTPFAGDVAKLLSELSGVERVAFYNSGTEAVMFAVRLARETHKKNKIVIFNGSFHGTFDGVNATKDYTSQNMECIPTSLGTPKSFVNDIIMLDYGNKDELKVIEQYADEIAAVLVEPVQSRRPQLQPVEFLQELRTITEHNNMALIFDEVITGFRLCKGGAQEYYHVKADIVTYGKIVGGGMPIGVVSGKAKYLDKIDGGVWNYEDDSAPDPNLIITGGTFSCHPISMTAAKATLTYIKEHGDTMYDGMNQKTEYIVSELNKFYQEKNIPLEMVYCKSMLSFKPKGNVMFLRFLFYFLIEKGIYIWEGATCFLSVAHTDEDIQYFIDKVIECCNLLLDSKVF